MHGGSNVVWADVMAKFLRILAISQPDRQALSKSSATRHVSVLQFIHSAPRVEHLLPHAQPSMAWPPGTTVAAFRVELDFGVDSVVSWRQSYNSSRDRALIHQKTG